VNVPTGNTARSANALLEPRDYNHPLGRSSTRNVLSEFAATGTGALNQPATNTKASQRRSAALRFDIVGGMTAAAVVLPKAMAYATVAGLPVAVGLYTAFVPMVVYALLGSSRVLSVSSTTTLAILTATQLDLVVPDGDPAQLVTATATLTALVGAMLLLARLLRLGFVANFISASVLTGFKAGIGFVIVLDQVPKLLGIHITKQGFFVDFISVVQHIPQTSLTTLAVAVATFVVIFGMERLWPRAPAPLIAVGGGIAAAWFLGLQALGVSTVGAIPQGFPSLTMPDPALVASARAVARLAAARHARGDRHRLFRRPHPTSGIRCHSQSAHDGVSLGNRCRARRAGAWYAEGHRSGDHLVADRAVEPECQPAGIGHRSQARGRCAAPLVAGKPG